jgi:hypothetical protein
MSGRGRGHLGQRREQTRQCPLLSGRRVLAWDGFHRAKITNIPRNAGGAVGEQRLPVTGNVVAERRQQPRPVATTCGAVGFVNYK